MPEWEQVTGLAPIWKPMKKGDKIQGTVLDVKQGKFGPMAIVDQGNNNLIATPSNTVLKNQIENFKKGDQIRVTYLGEGGKGKRKYKNFKIERKKA